MLLGLNQHGFQRNHSTDTALASIISVVSEICGPKNCYDLFGTCTISTKKRDSIRVAD